MTSFPDWLEQRVAAAPEYSDRTGFAKIHSESLGPLSPRTLEDWPLVWKRVNGRAVTRTRNAMEVAWRRFDAAPEYLGGRGKKTA